jgi:nicotinate dehydrogenase subunit B
VRKNDFLGVVAPHEYDAIQAAAQLKVTWAEPPAVLAGHGNEFEHMRTLDSAGKTVAVGVDTDRVAPADGGAVDRAHAAAAHVASGSYGWPTNIHTPIGPQCAVADVTPQGARILSGTQGVYGTRQLVASVLGMPESKVRVTAFPMGGCFGDGAQYYDVAQAAALMSQLAGAPVRVQLMRWDEIGWGQTSPASLMDVRAGIDANGKLVAFDFTHFYPQYWSDTSQTNAELAGAPLPAVTSGVAGNFWPAPMYDVGKGRYLLKSIPLRNNWIKAFWLRAGSSPHATFAGEQVIDELAHAAVIQWSSDQPRGVGEPVAMAAAAAVANAVFDATGVRLRTAPFTPARVRAALKAAGVA